ncbi:MAG: hypothetical protein U0I89_03880 [Prevotella sp.]|nr:hypothetical protein [Prevotella sp.]
MKGTLKWSETYPNVVKNPYSSHAASTVMNMENGRYSCSHRPL